jgi:hypothetical protein
MWIWKQSEGTLTHNGVPVAKGYAGAPAAINDSAQQDKKNVGPIPVGLYKIGTANKTSHLGPIVFPLTPDTGNEMFGRSAFYIHWDSRKKPGTASQGCIVLTAMSDGRNPLPAFQALAETMDRWIVVV